MFLCGIDENGLGPRLGPLVATAVTLELPTYDRAQLRDVAVRAGIDDSKQTAGFGQMAFAESVALAVVAQLAGEPPRDADELLQRLALDGLSPLRARCPAASSPQCWSAAISLPAFGGDLDKGRVALSCLAQQGVTLVRVRSAIACVSALRELIARVGSRTSADLALFERLLLDARAAVGADLEAVLGMVGGIRDYPRYFSHLHERTFEVLHQDRKLVRYNSPGLGRLSFEVDADARHLPVALASMIGKYVRELAMERQNRFYEAHDATLRRASGYHDPVTRRFVEQSAPLRRRLGIVDACFER